MSKAAWVLFIALAAVMVIANAFPLSGGEAVVCTDQGVRKQKRTTVLGLPFGFYTTTGSNACTRAGDDNVADDQVRRNVFTPASLWFDLIIAEALLLGAYGLLGRGGDTK